MVSQLSCRSNQQFRSVNGWLIHENVRPIFMTLKDGCKSPLLDIGGRRCAPHLRNAISATPVWSVSADACFRNAQRIDFDSQLDGA
jgi:hypothetical protein